MNAHPRFTLKATVAATLCALAAPHALAQAVARESTEVQTVETMVVTAQKREQMAIDVPASVSTVSAERLQLSGAVRFEDYVAQIPGMTITAQSRGFSSVVLRGICTGISQAMPSTAYYIDEAPVGSITAYARGSTLTPDLDPYDLRRVEVLKGPQGTLYGAGAVGGLLRYVTVPPDSTKFGGAVSLGGNNVSHGGNGYEGRVALNIPLVKDSMAIRVSGFDRQDAGFIDDPTRKLSDVNEAKTRGGRVAFGWNFAPDWSLLATAQTQRFRTDGLGVEDLNGPALTPDTRRARAWQQRGREAGHQPRRLQCHDQRPRRHLRPRLVDDLPEGQGRDARSMRPARSAPLFGAALPHSQPRCPDAPDRQHRALGAGTAGAFERVRRQAELRRRRLLHPGGEHQPAAARGPVPDPRSRPAAAAASRTGRLQRTPVRRHAGREVRGVFAVRQRHLQLHAAFDVTAGVRFSHDDQHFDQNYAKSIAVPVPVVFSQDVTHSTTTGLLNAIYKLDRDTAVYARVASGYRPGGPSALPASIGKPSLRPRLADQLRAGLQVGIRRRQGVVRGGDLHHRLEGHPGPDQATVSGGTTYQHFVNGGTARSRGAEATFMVFPMSGLALRATGAYTDSRLTEDAPVVGGLDGDRMPFVPKWTGFVLGRLPVPIGSACRPGSAARSATSASGARTSASSPMSSTFRRTPHSGLNAGVDVGNVRFSLYGKNLSDERGINFVNPIGRGDALANPWAIRMRPA